MSNFEYECALTSITSPGAEEDDSDGMEDMPVGWTKIRFTRRQFNPKWLALQQLKETMAQGAIMQHTGGHPETATNQQKLGVALQIEASFYMLESDTPMYILDVDDSVFVSDSGEVIKSLDEIRDMVGLGPMPEISEESETNEPSEQEAVK